MSIYSIAELNNHYYLINVAKLPYRIINNEPTQPIELLEYNDYENYIITIGNYNYKLVKNDNNLFNLIIHHTENQKQNRIILDNISEILFVMLLMDCLMIITLFMY